MKAVVWTDVFQSLIMIAGLLAIVIQVIFNSLQLREKVRLMTIYIMRCWKYKLIKCSKCDYRMAGVNFDDYETKKGCQKFCWILFWRMSSGALNTEAHVNYWRFLAPCENYPLYGILTVLLVFGINGVQTFKQCCVYLSSLYVKSCHVLAIKCVIRVYLFL